MELAEKIQLLIDKHGLTVADVARRGGIEDANLRNILRGTSRDPGVSRVYAIARGLGTTIEDLLNLPALSLDATESPAYLPIRCKVGGGWVEQDDTSQTLMGRYDATPIARFAKFRQWIELLDGESMNQILPSGSYLHVIDANAMGYVPRHNDIVIIERERDGGFLRERSAKQVVINDGHVELWARSNVDNPKWNKPIVLNDHPDDETVTVTLRGLVARSYTDLLS